MSAQTGLHLWVSWPSVLQYLFNVVLAPPRDLCQTIGWPPDSRMAFRPTGDLSHTLFRIFDELGPVPIAKATVKCIFKLLLNSPVAFPSLASFGERLQKTKRIFR